MARRVMMIRTCGQWRVGQIVPMLADAAAELVARRVARYIDDPEPQPEPESMVEEPARNAALPNPRKGRKRTTRRREVDTKGTKDGEEKADS